MTAAMPWSAVDAAYARYERDLVSAYRNPVGGGETLVDARRKKVTRDPRGRIISTSEEEEEEDSSERRTSDARQRSYDAYTRDLVNAWRNPGFGGNETITGAGSHGSVGQREGDLCTIDGKPGHLRMVNAALRCVPDRVDAAAERRCPHCGGNGLDPDYSGDDCPVCHGTGLVSAKVSANYETTTQAVSNAASTHTESARRADGAHQQRMAELYDARDRELEQMWRQP
jgi:hypothetical protein